MTGAAEVIWFRRATLALHEIFQFIAADNPRAAEKVVRRIKKAEEILIEHPAIGRPGRVRGTRELVITGTPYIVPYRIKGEAIEILHVIHTSRKWPDVFEDKL